MKTVNTIMVAIDFSPYSINAAKYAIRLANDVDAKILLVNIYDQRHINLMNTIADRLPEFSVEKHVERQIKEREKMLTDLAKKLGYDSLKIDTTVSIGIPFKALLREIEKKKPDLLVMGIKGRSNVTDVIVGSCARKMFRRCPIPLLSIREK